MNKKLKFVYSFVISASVTVVFIVASTIYSELSPPFKNFLKETFAHHWIGKGVIAIILFAVVGLLLDTLMTTKVNADKLTVALKILSIVSILGFLAIVGFFVYEGLLA